MSRSSSRQQTDAAGLAQIAGNARTRSGQDLRPGTVIEGNVHVAILAPDAQPACGDDDARRDRHRRRRRRRAPEARAESLGRHYGPATCSRTGVGVPMRCARSAPAKLLSVTPPCSLSPNPSRYPVKRGFGARQMVTLRVRVRGLVPDPSVNTTRTVTRCRPGASGPGREIVILRCSGVPRRRRTSRPSTNTVARLMRVPCSVMRDRRDTQRPWLALWMPATAERPAAGGRGPGGMTAPGWSGCPGTTGVSGIGVGGCGGTIGLGGFGGTGGSGGTGGTGVGSSGQVSVVSIVLLSRTVTPPVLPVAVAVFVTTESLHSSPGSSVLREQS